MDTLLQLVRALPFAEFNMSVLLLLVVISSVILANKMFSSKPDVREPPIVSSSIPIIGHTLGIFWYKMRYYTLLRCVISTQTHGGELTFKLQQKMPAQDIHSANVRRSNVYCCCARPSDFGSEEL